MRSRLRLAASFALLMLSACGSPAESANERAPRDERDSTLGTMERDVVALLDRGEEVAGDAAFETTHAHFRYRFASAGSRAAFTADPARYEIQLGGGCGRMGALSGTGSTDLFAVHEGRLYIFASEGCRTGFLASPERFLEPLNDFPGGAPVGGSGGTQHSPAPRAMELLASATAWVGGPRRLDGVELDWVKEENLRWDGTTHSTLERRQVGPWARYRVESRYDGDSWVKELEGDVGVILEPGTEARPMQLAQLRSIQRRAQSHVLFVLQGRGDGGAVLTTEPSIESGVEIVHVWLSGFSHRIGIRTETGEILWHAYLGVGPDQVFGSRRDTFKRWQTVDGLRVPFAWTRTFDGQPQDPIDWTGEGWTLNVRGSG